MAEWLRRGLQILSIILLTYIISPSINLFTFNTDCKCHPGLKPNEVTRGSSYVAKLKCFKCDYKWKRMIHTFTRRPLKEPCPNCRKQSVGRI